MLDSGVNSRVYTDTMKTQNSYKIGQLASVTGLTVDTIRFYESKGLITPATRSASGYRLYSQVDITTLQFIQRAKRVGFTLDEIHELLALKLHPDDHTCEEVKKYTADKMLEVNEKIAELVRIRNSLQALHNVCCGGNESAAHCSILQMLDTVDTL